MVRLERGSAADAHIIAVTARSPVGLTAETTAAAIRAGISRVREHPSLIDGSGDQLLCGQDGLLGSTLPCVERISQLDATTLRRALEKTLSSGRRASSVPVLLALPTPRPGFTSGDVARIVAAVQTAGAPPTLNLTVKALGTGHAGVHEALSEARKRIELGDTDFCAVTAADSYLDPHTVDWLDADRKLTRANARSGFHPGEASATLIVANSSVMRDLRSVSLATLRAIGLAQEVHDMHTGAGPLGEAYTQALSQAASDTLEQRGYIHDVYCDINGERSRTTDWGFVSLRLGQWFRKTSEYTTPVVACGDVGAATGALNAVLAIRAWERNYAHGPRALICGSSWHGTRGAILLERTHYGVS